VNPGGVTIMIEKPQLSKRFDIEPRDFVRAGEASLQVQRLLKNIGFEADLIRRVSVCAYEAEMNVVMYGGKGELALQVDTNEIVLEVRDEGNGIEDIEAALREGFSTATPEFREMGFGAGMGLPNIKKNADLLNVRSEPEKGTQLEIHFRLSKES
jgi:serine/threonine-protein kinase RsbT